MARDLIKKAQWMKARRAFYTEARNRNGYASQRKLREAALKNMVLSHYGPENCLRCNWVGCEVVDLDLLTIDHVNNDGAKHRRELKSLNESKGRWRGGDFYAWLLKNNLPDGFQTLCWNHQWKKRLLHLRGEGIK